MFAQFKREERRGDKRPFPQFSFLLPWLTGQMHCVEYNEVPVVPASKENKDFGRRRRRKNARENDENAIFLASPNARLTSNSHIYVHGARTKAG